MRRKLKIIIPATIVFIVSLVLSVEYLLHSDKILTRFIINEVSFNSTEFNINFESVKAATKYSILISDKNNRKVYERDTNTNTNKITLSNLEYGMEYSVMVFAIDKYGDTRPCEEAYSFTWDEPMFNSESSILLKNEEYSLDIVGEYKENTKYSIRVSKEDEILMETDINDYDFLVPLEYYKDIEVVLTVTLLKDNNRVSEIKLYNNINPISDIKIVTPGTDITIPYNDVSLVFEGGDNALEYVINVYNGNVLTKSSKTSKHSVILSKNLFGPTYNYRLEVIGKYENYEKKDSVNISIADKEQLKPVYISNNWKHVKKGAKISLGCPSEDAKIYYTTNGDNPESNGILYTEPIEINNDIVLKTVAVSDTKHNSIIKEYPISVSTKENLKIYLSPSNQGANYGVQSTGFTNERDEMNDVTNYIEERLKQIPNVEIMRNNPSGNINEWNLESIYFGADFKIAIHSNGSTDHKSRGIETWIYSEESDTYSIANQIQNGLWNIYPYNDDSSLNRGVKYANGALGEANDNYAPFQLLVEIAHHDDLEDAEWIMNNKKLIGYNIADSILKYFGMID